MRRIYISFLGAGDYDPAVYYIKHKNKKAYRTNYVQAAELQLSGTDYFDKIFLVMTKTSKKKNFNLLKSELSKLGIDKVHGINITEDLNPENHWSWFEEILFHIDNGDELTVDLTHGFRIIPIVFSNALNFLQKAKNIKLKSVYYGAYESNKDLSPIIDVKEFYIINEWTDAVSRLVEDADPGKLGEVAKKEGTTILHEFDDPDLITAFDELTQSLKNVDIHNVGHKAEKALEIIRQKESAASETGKILLMLVREKFVNLLTEEPDTGRYDFNYFNLQLEIIDILLGHKLFMQAYTVMREMLGSFGLVRMKEKAKIHNKKGRRERKKAEIFIRMLQKEKAKWIFTGDELKINKKLTPLYDDMEKHGIIKEVRTIAEDLVKFRNGFDHAWTKKPEALQDIEISGKKFYSHLNAIVKSLKNYNYF